MKILRFTDLAGIEWVLVTDEQGEIVCKVTGTEYDALEWGEVAR